jgi:hypothetical protein
MRTLISNDDLKTLLQGASAVVLAGLLLGGVMQPSLDAGDKPLGPQMLMGGGTRGGGYAADPGVAAYGGATPEYVIGTDWTRPKTPQYVQYAQADTGDAGDVMAYEADDPPAPAEVTRTTWRDEPREATVYPSERGNAYYEANLPRPPDAPDETDGADPG